MKHLDTSNIAISNDGRVVLTDDALQTIEADFTVSVGGAGTNSTTCDGTNAVCRNTGDCSKSTNQDACTNSRPSCRDRDAVILA